ncbi:putative protein OS=Streptomyces alboniger OX=132473 GN=CP975_06035 PE=3 SV=1 [Streptomyces alboniger]
MGGESGDEFWGKARDAIGLFAPLSGGLRRVQLIAIAPRGQMLKSIDSIGTRRAIAGDAELVLLDINEREVGSYFVADVTINDVSPPRRNSELVDLTVTLDCEDLFQRPNSPGGLSVPGGWIVPAGGIHSERERKAWLSVALNHHGFGERDEPEPNAVYELDGRFIVDESSFYCTLGEAINGPGGYFGWNLSAVDDCLTADWGATTPFTLNWRHSEEARSRIAASEKLDNSYDGRFIEFLDDVFARHNVEIKLL